LSPTTGDFMPFAEFLYRLLLFCKAKGHQARTYNVFSMHIPYRLYPAWECFLHASPANMRTECAEYRCNSCVTRKPTIWLPDHKSYIVNKADDEQFHTTSLSWYLCLPAQGQKTVQGWWCQLMK